MEKPRNPKSSNFFLPTSLALLVTALQAKSFDQWVTVQHFISSHIIKRSETCLITHIQAFIHLGYFYSASSNPLRLRSASDTARIGPTMPEFHAETPRATASEGLAQGTYLAAIAEFKPATLRTKGDESTNALPRPAH